MVTYVAASTYAFASSSLHVVVVTVSFVDDVAASLVHDTTASVATASVLRLLCHLLIFPLI